MSFNSSSLSQVIIFIGFCLFSFVTYSPSFAQGIQFEEEQEIFSHPNTSYYSSRNPFLPFDYNQDSIPDFIGHGEWNQSSRRDEQLLLIGKGNNEFDYVDIYGGRAREPLKVMDFDLDGDLDIIMPEFIYLLDSENNFTSFDPRFNFSETIVQVADFNGDGLNDIITHYSRTFDPDDLILYYNLGDNSFRSEIILDAYDYDDIEIGDIDNDGNIDILVSLSFEEIPAIILFNRGGTFDLQEIPHRFDGSATTIKLTDLDNDSDLDIIAAGVFDNIFILKNTDNFSVDTEIQTIVLPDIELFDIADLNSDGRSEIIILHSIAWDYAISIYRGLGNGDFDPSYVSNTINRESYYTLQNPNYRNNNLAIYDYDFDGLLDIIYVDEVDRSASVMLLRNITPFDGDQDGFIGDDDCDDNDISINPDAPEIPDNEIDENCDGLLAYSDNDGDGFDTRTDCDDTDPSINSDATEIPNNEFDENCDGLVEVIDEDGDGFNSAMDCDDSNPNVYPNAVEIPNNNIDENCDGEDAIQRSLAVDNYSVQVYPNPGTQFLNINLSNGNGDVELRVWSLKGKLVSQQRLSMSNLFEISSWPNGISILEILHVDSRKRAYVKHLKVNN